jgi:hypothetical protein
LIGEEERLRETIKTLLEGEKKTPDEWKLWVTNSGFTPNAVKLKGRPEETTQELIDKFMDDILEGVVANYKYFNKKQRKELGIDNLFSRPEPEEEVDPENVPELTSHQKVEVTGFLSAKSRSLMELYNIVLRRVAIVNIENVNVAKVSLLSKKVGVYLSNTEQLFADIKSSIELEEPISLFFKLFINLFLTMKKQVVLDAAKSAKVTGFVSNLIVEYNRNRYLRQELRTMVSDNDEVVANIISLLNNGKPVLKTHTLIGSVFDKNKETYKIFLESLLPNRVLKR